MRFNIDAAAFAAACSFVHRAIDLCHTKATRVRDWHHPRNDIRRLLREEREVRLHQCIREAHEHGAVHVLAPQPKRVRLSLHLMLYNIMSFEIGIIFLDEGRDLQFAKKGPHDENIFNILRIWQRLEHIQ